MLGLVRWALKTSITVFGPNWIGSGRSLRRSRSDTPYLLEHADEDKDPRKKTRICTLAVQITPIQ